MKGLSTSMILQKSDYFRADGFLKFFLPIK